MANPLSGLMETLQSSMGALVGNATKDEKSEPGPDDVGPTSTNKTGGGLVSLEMTEAEVGEWWKRIDRATARTDKWAERWDILLDEYRPIVVKSGTAEDVKVGMHFRNVHSKVGQLFYRSPELILTAKDPSPAMNQMPNPMQAMMPGVPMPPLTMEDIISVKQQVLQTKLGRDGLKVSRLMDELLFDVLGWSGIGASKLGYKCVMKAIPQPVMQPAQTPLQPAGVLGLSQPQPEMEPGQPPPMEPVMDPATGQPMTQMEEVPIFEDYYWRRFSPKKLIFNDDLRSTRFDEDATWIGMHFYMSPRRAKRELKLTDDEVKAATADERVHKYDEDAQSDKSPGLVHGVEIWCKASVFTDEEHPQVINQLILIENIKSKPFVWRMNPDQEFDPQTGKLTQDSMIGFPIRVLTIRDIADSPYPEADSAFTNSEIKQISTYRRQGVQLRDAAIGKYAYDGGAIGEEDLPKLKNGTVGEFIEMQEGKMAQGLDKILAPIAQVHATLDDYKGEALLKQDVNETLGISANQAGTPESTVRTATEIAGVASAIAARNDKERGRVTDFYLDGARLIDGLLMRYATSNDYIELTGADGAKRMQVWNNELISGRYLYDIAPDSQQQVDTAVDFLQLLNFYNLAAKDPLFNRPYILRKLARMKGLDPAKVVLDPMQVMGQPPHGGPGEAVNEHQASNSGKKENSPGAENTRDTQVK